MGASYDIEKLTDQKLHITTRVITAAVWDSRRLQHGTGIPPDLIQRQPLRGRVRHVNRDYSRRLGFCGGDGFQDRHNAGFIREKISL